jgi:hypothetical protein
MSTGVLTQRIAEASPRLKARIAGVFYLLTFLTGPHRGRVLCRGDAALLWHF